MNAMSQQYGTNARAGHGGALEIVATGFAFPGLEIDNDEYFRRCRFAIGDRAELEQSTGVKRRRWCAEGENTWTMARAAIEMALATGPVRGEDIDVVLASSCSTMPTVTYPDPANPFMTDLSPHVLAALGRDDGVGIDIKGAYCAGFFRAMQVLDGLLQNPNYRTGMIVASEQGGIFATAESNRSPFCFIFGDSAGAVIFRRREPGVRVGVLDYNGYTRASLKHAQTWGPDGRSVFVKGAVAGPASMEMMVECARGLLARNRLTPADIDWFLPAQGPAALQDALCQVLEIPRDKLLWRADTTGYTASASIPTCLAQYTHEGKVKKGDLLLSLAVGAGMNCGGALYYY